jgi:hypothetical protein
MDALGFKNLSQEDKDWELYSALQRIELNCPSCSPYTTKHKAVNITGIITALGVAAAAAFKAYKG